jgi:hypothetical protein
METKVWELKGEEFQMTCKMFEEMENGSFYKGIANGKKGSKGNNSRSIGRVHRSQYGRH